MVPKGIHRKLKCLLRPLRFKSFLDLTRTFKHSSTVYFHICRMLLRATLTLSACSIEPFPFFRLLFIFWLFVSCKTVVKLTRRTHCLQTTLRSHFFFFAGGTRDPVRRTCRKSSFSTAIATFWHLPLYVRGALLSWAFRLFVL